MKTFFLFHKCVQNNNYFQKYCQEGSKLRPNIHEIPLLINKFTLTNKDQVLLISCIESWVNIGEWKGAVMEMLTSLRQAWKLTLLWEKNQLRYSTRSSEFLLLFTLWHSFTNCTLSRLESHSRLHFVLLQICKWQWKQPLLVLVRSELRNLQVSSVCSAPDVFAGWGVGPSTRSKKFIV